MNILPFVWFPKERFHPDFPMAVWFAGLWFYLKSFLYLCYLYNIGLEPAPYSRPAVIEIVYFAVTMFPALAFGVLMWNSRLSWIRSALVFLAVDTPFLGFHVLRMGQQGFLDSGLTKLVEFGALGLNVAAVTWLGRYYFQARTGEAIRAKD